MQDFKRHLEEQLDFIDSSIAAYDAGKEHEAKRLAVPIRTLVHNTRGSTALLKHLKVQKRIGWVDRGPPDPPPGSIVISFGLCVIYARLDIGESRYVPAMKWLAPDRLHPPVSFEDWWRRSILGDAQGNKFSRADLVLSVANQDGGAHIDAALEERYRQLTRDNSLGIVQSPGRPIANSLVLASVRHIAEELAQTVRERLAWNGQQVVVPEPVCGLRLGSKVQAGRNDSCPCGSGLKFKNCFLRREPFKVMYEGPADSQAGQVHPIPGPPLPMPDQAVPPSLVLDSFLLTPVEDGSARAA